MFSGKKSLGELGSGAERKEDQVWKQIQSRGDLKRGWVTSALFIRGKWVGIFVSPGLPVID